LAFSVTRPQFAPFSMEHPSAQAMPAFTAVELGQRCAAPGRILPGPGLAGLVYSHSCGPIMQRWLAAPGPLDAASRHRPSPGACRGALRPPLTGCGKSRDLE